MCLNITGSQKHQTRKSNHCLIINTENDTMCIKWRSIDIRYHNKPVVNRINLCTSKSMKRLIRMTTTTKKNKIMTRLLRVTGTYVT